MSHLFKSYIDYLSSNPGEFTSLLLWLITMTAVYVVLIVFRKKMVHGASGENGFMESSEQVLYVMNWVWPAIVSYAAYFRDEEWIQWFMFGAIAWALGGRWLFEWALVFKAGGTKVVEPVTVKTVTEKKIETKEQSTETKLDPK